MSDIALTLASITVIPHFHSFLYFKKSKKNLLIDALPLLWVVVPYLGRDVELTIQSLNAPKSNRGLSKESLPLVFLWVAGISFSANETGGLWNANYS